MANEESKEIKRHPKRSKEESIKKEKDGDAFDFSDLAAILASDR